MQRGDWLGNVVYLWNRLPRSKPRSWLKHKSVSVVCVINTRLGKTQEPYMEENGCNSSHNTLLHGAKRVFPAKPSTNNINCSKSSLGNETPSTGQKQPRKTTTLSSVTDVKSLLQLTKLQLTKCLGTNTTALVLCDTGCINSLVTDSIEVRLGLQGIPLKLVVRGKNEGELFDTKLV